MLLNIEKRERFKIKEHGSHKSKSTQTNYMLNTTHKHHNTFSLGISKV